ncbi:hypothetical protein EDC32_1011346 [Laceyella sacchari]|uniref:hypothetical protein n=1 Tax=Laceyella sacchari TaxID=37482 RepID=UPI0010505C5F|nr:hypothetical protein [Laceyella sacchari]TCW41679.1 hypothetical protein EDC32_1011346 [Laceyella sacchari]
MNLKRVSLCLLALACALIIPFTTASASEVGQKGLVVPKSTVLSGNGASTYGPGEWDYVGSSTFTYSSAYAYSGGGDFMVCLASGPSTTYYLYEYDPNNADEFVGYVYLSAGQCGVFRGIGGYVDGDNKKAEFYVEKDVGGTATVDFWD